MTDEPMRSSTEPNADADAVPGRPTSRRDFLKTSAIAAATSIVTGCASVPRRGAGPAILPAGRPPERIQIP